MTDDSMLIIKMVKFPSALFKDHAVGWSEEESGRLHLIIIKKLINVLIKPQSKLRKHGGYSSRLILRKCKTRKMPKFMKY